MGVRSTNPTQSFFDDFFRSGTEASGIVRATGGAISFASGKTIHSFTSSGSFNVDVGPLTVEYLVVAGGGGGEEAEPSPVQPASPPSAAVGSVKLPQ